MTCCDDLTLSTDLPPLPLVWVAAVALIDTDGRILLAQRPAGKSMAGLWEFPGGKIQPNETPEQALIRELSEELGITTKACCLSPLTFVSHRYDAFHLIMHLYACRVWQGTPIGLEKQNLTWAHPRQLDQYPMPPADLPLAIFLKKGI